MSYDIKIIDPSVDPSFALRLPEGFIPPRGGTFALGDFDQAEFNITYNYSSFFRMLLGEKGIRSLYGQDCEDTVPILKEAIRRLPSDPPPSDDYWEANEGNVKRALEGLLAMARALPHGIWAGD